MSLLLSISKCLSGEARVGQILCKVMRRNQFAHEYIQSAGDAKADSMCVKHSSVGDDQVPTVSLMITCADMYSCKGWESGQHRRSHGLELFEERPAQSVCKGSESLHLTIS